MEKIISEYLSGLTLGDPQVYKNFAAIPLFHPADCSPHYLTLKEALEQGALTITEVGSEGTVPERKYHLRDNRPSGDPRNGKTEERCLVDEGEP